MFLFSGFTLGFWFMLKAMQSVVPGSCPSSSTHQLCNLEHVTGPLCLCFLICKIRMSSQDCWKDNIMCGKDFTQYLAQYWINAGGGTTLWCFPRAHVGGKGMFSRTQACPAVIFLHRTHRVQSAESTQPDPTWALQRPSHRSAL